VPKVPHRRDHGTSRPLGLPSLGGASLRLGSRVTNDDMARVLYDLQSELDEGPSVDGLGWVGGSPCAACCTYLGQGRVDGYPAPVLSWLTERPPRSRRLASEPEVLGDVREDSAGDDGDDDNESGHGESLASGRPGRAADRVRPTRATSARTLSNGSALRCSQLNALERAGRYCRKSSRAEQTTRVRAHGSHRPAGHEDLQMGSGLPPRSPRSAARPQLTSPARLTRGGRRRRYVVTVTGMQPTPQQSAPSQVGSAKSGVRRRC
jgi:hypothetical protein